MDVQIGSITGGGRYDNLTGIFGMPGVSGVGISFGIDRIYDVLDTLHKYATNDQSGTQVIFVSMGEAEQRYAMRWACCLREQGLRVEVYPDVAKMKKQLGYADANNIRYVAIVGSNEMASNQVMLKDMIEGEQELVSQEELIHKLQSK